MLIARLCIATEIVPTSDLQTAFQDADVAILVGGFPRKQGMQRCVPCFV